MKDSLLRFRVKQEWHDTIQQMAAKNGVTMSQMMNYAVRCMFTGETPTFEKLRDEINRQFTPRSVDRHLADLREELGEESEMERFLRDNGAFDADGRFVAVG